MTWLLRPGRVPYPVALEVMHDLASRRASGLIPDTLILLEHPPTFTAGSRSDPGHVLWGEERIEESGAGFHRVDRGGSVTFHGPGQLVGYPIVDLGRRPDLAGFLSRLEEVAIRSGADVGLELTRDPAQAGVWSGPAKVCAIGVRLKRWRVTLHGFGLNCDTDLDWFDAIVPCGLADRSVTSLSRLAGRDVSVSVMEPLVMRHFSDVFETSLEPAPDALATRFRVEAAP
jgi:lipoyl(octanoyl) transferase